MTSEVYTKEIEVRWSDLDANGHLRNTGFSDYASHTRLAFLAENGFPARRFHSLGLGPVIFREEARYHKEVFLGESVTVSFEAAGFSGDGSQWRVHHELRKASGALAAVVRLDGGWLDLGRRRLVTPPDDLVAALMTLNKTDDYAELPSVALG